MYYVYLLQMEKKGGKEFYIGYTQDLRKRFKQHCNGQNRTTKGRQPQLVYYEAYNDKHTAMAREKGLKNSGSVYMALMKRIGLK